ncbi:Hsp70 family protein [Anaeromyxobacter oryzisoli]|uniref:Hsp70 family protein n=1 Tax=Anaeromyxobacter oryzisoli TaxID=2925408 RepID=UPI001F5794C1|nr:Hsp70 family protein [Anaeromyxobacter sp. SG63]
MAGDRARAVGIDLGTTNSALAYRALGPEPGAAEVLPIPQLVQPGEVEPRSLLPSFLYLPHEAELPPGSTGLPWDPAASGGVVGALARTLGAQTPIRLVASAKSWLSHAGVDRRAPVLPAGAPPEVPRVSPLEASARYLAHLRAAWDHAFAREDPDAALARQQVTLTVPASFDAVARELTVEAARAAGLPAVTLLEEPQAALYAWVEAMGDAWRDEVKPGDLVLVVDIGGGTTDLSLIAVVDRGGDLGLERVAVGDHILLGGDNMDLALAHAIAEALAREGRRLDRWQLTALTHGAREAKELLFADRALAEAPIVVPGRGASLVGGAVRTSLTRAVLEAVLVDGFFPRVEVTGAPVAARRGALTALGLPYASDPAVTRHLAAFLSRHRVALRGDAAPVPLAGEAFLHPTAILFNGGVTKAAPLVARVVEVVSGWLAAEGAAPPRVLPAADPDLAVARGAAAYGRVRAGHGIRIRGGTARAYYVGVEASVPAVPGLPTPVRAVCLAPMGMEEGTSADLPGEELGLVVGEPVEFRLFTSSSRHDRAGEVVEEEEPLEEMPPVTVTVPPGARPAGEVVPVRLRSHVTEIGTLELECVGREGRAYRLEWNLRQAPGGGATAGAGAGDPGAAPPA